MKWGYQGMTKAETRKARNDYREKEEYKNQIEEHFKTENDKLNEIYKRKK